MPAPWSAMERRILRLTVVASMFAVAAAVFGVLPDGIATYFVSEYPSEAMRVEIDPAGSWLMLVWGVLQVTFALLARKRPDRRAAGFWLCFAIVIDIVAVAMWMLANVQSADQELLWAGQMMMVGAGGHTVLVLLVLPVVMFASDQALPTDAPHARVVER